MRCGCGGQQRFGIANVAKGDQRATLDFIVVNDKTDRCLPIPARCYLRVRDRINGTAS